MNWRKKLEKENNTQAIHPLEAGSVFLIDKPYKWTSFDVVGKIRGWAKAQCGHKIKVGHAGTLDPLATGLLIVCTGKFTKRIDEFQAYDKEYTGTFVLGKTTPSFDLETEIKEVGDYKHLTPEIIKSCVQNFIGEIEQIPPAFSAIKINGKRAYEYARKDKEIVLSCRKTTILSFEIERIELPEVDFRIRCSKGTYIRSIARDLGELLGCGAYLSALRRTRIGEFKIEEAISPTSL